MERTNPSPKVETSCEVQISNNQSNLRPRDAIDQDLINSGNLIASTQFQAQVDTG